MRRTLKWLALAMAGVVVLLVLAGLLVPLLLDVDRYRGLIESEAEKILGRNVSLGETKVSVFPVLGIRVDDLEVAGLPEEGVPTVMSAKSLRVGARLWPLLRKRLEVTSLVVDEPAMTLVRGPDGAWSVKHLIATEGGEAGEQVEMRVDRLRVRGGRLTLRDAMASPPREETLSGIDLSIDDFAPGRVFPLQLVAGVASMPEARLRFSGTIGPLPPSEASPLRIEGQLEAAAIDPAIARWLPEGALPAGLLGARPLSLAAEVSMAGSDVGLRDVVVSDAELVLRRAADGAWNLPSGSPDGAEGSTPAFLIEKLSTRGVSVRIVDDGAAKDAPASSLDDVTLTLEQFPLDGAARIDATATLRGGSASARVTLGGSLGPSDKDGLALDLKVAGSDLPLAGLAPLLPSGPLDTARARTSLDLSLQGRWPEQLTVRGRAGIRDAAAQVTALDGVARRVPIDLDGSLDLTARSGGEALALRSVEIRFPTREGTQPVTVSGSLRTTAKGADADLDLSAPRVRADDLVGLLSLAGIEAPFTFSATEPVELRARVRGPLGGERLPDIEGTARIAGFSLRHPSMSAPLERVSARASFTGQRVELTDLRGEIGSSDLGGRLAVTIGTPVRIRADLSSGKADIWELLSFINTDEGEAGGTAASKADAFDPMRDVVLEGTLKVGEGTFHTLAFSGLDCGLRFEKGTLTISPLSTGLYGGSFKGSLAQNLVTTPITTALSGEAAGVDAGPFLLANLGLKDVLTGRATARLDVTTSGGGFEPIIRGLGGGGTITLANGRVGQLDVLKSLSKVTGVFGETTLKRISRQLATSGTEFTELKAGLSFQDGTLAFRDMQLTAPEFSLQGAGVIDMLAASLEGQFLAAFATDVSSTMRAEGSRAASVFWNSGTERVEMPFGLRGPVAGPQPIIEWKKIAGDALKRKMGDELKRLLGGKRRGTQETTTAPEATPPAGGEPATGGTPGDASSLGPGGVTEPAAAPPPGPALSFGATIDAPRWSSSFLAPSLKLSGTLRGEEVERASLLVRDANGLPVLRVDRMPAVEELGRAAADPERPAEARWQTEVDGKKLLVAKYPLTVVVTVTGAGGQTTEAEAAVGKR